MRLNHLVVALAILALIGFADASFLTLEHYRGAVPPCIGLNGCAIVTTSPYSFLLGIPVALLGTLYYLTVLIGSFIFFDSRNPLVAKLVAAITPLGFLFSAWFVYVQAFILRAFCTWCLVSATTSTLIFIVGTLILYHHTTWRERLAAWFN